jgi:hypothetical protein
MQHAGKLFAGRELRINDHWPSLTLESLLLDEIKDLYRSAK